MTAKHPKTAPAPLREQITAYLTRKPEATAKDIAQHTSDANFPSRVLNELNKMRTDALVECEKRKGKGNEYWYWLSQTTHLDTPPNNGACEDANRVGPANAPSTSPREAAAVQTPAPARAPTPTVAPVAEDDNYLLNVIADIRAAVGDPTGKVMLGELARHIEAKLQNHIATSERLAVELDEVRSQLSNAHALATKLNTLLESNRHECEALRAEVERHREQDKAQPEPAVDVLEAARAYVVRVPKRRPRIIGKPEKAREAALAAVRNGAARADVFALVEVGTARRGAEWKDGQ